MDARPQRPGRSVRVYGDENSMPITGVQKTIHQRNKSSPALSSMLQNGTTKGLLKRTAFGDVSNTANFARISRDDSDLGQKNDLKLSDKFTFVPPEKKSTALQKPAQRPLSISGLKPSLVNISSSIQESSLEKPRGTDPAPQPDHRRNINAKKSKAVLRDAVPVLKEENRASEASRIPSVAPLPPIKRDHQPLENTNVSKDLIEPQLIKNETLRSKVGDIVARKPEPSYEQPGSEVPSNTRSDGIYIDENGLVQVYQFEDAVETLGETVEFAGTRVPSHPLPQTASVPEEVCRSAPVQPVDAKIETIQKHILPPVSEPEEYWDEDGVDAYEEEGYVTARSFKSRTDNTTGNATMVLFPKVTQKVKKEIAAAQELVEASKTVEELEDEAWDTTMVAEYGDEIFQYMRELEIKMLPNAHYMDNQAEIQWSMRAVLMDWIVQVHHRFNLLPETLFLCANYIDRFLSCKVVSLGKLQLVGATAIFIAAKYEEIDCPSVQEIVYMVDNGYSVDEILKAERFMLSMLQFELGWPGPMSFLRRISKADDYDLETRTLAKYFLEITIMDERFVGSPPSFVAAGAHCLARLMLRKGNWSPAHVYYSDYTYSQLFPLILLMVECCEDARKHHCAIFDKYSDKRYKRASQFAETEMRRGFQVIDIASHNSPHLGGFSDSRHIWDQKQQQLVGEVY